MASEKFAENILTVCSTLQKRAVQYLLVGGTAVAFHGFVRPTTTRDGSRTDEDDFDFWYNPRFLNYCKLLDTIEDLGRDMTDVRAEQFFKLKNSFFRFRLNGFTVDFIPVIGGDLSFSDCYANRHIVHVGEVPVSILSLPDLIHSKKLTGRKKDMEDAAVLEEIQQRR